MPYPNEHAARLVDPEKFDPDSFRRVNDKFGDGIHAIFGKLKGENSMTLQLFVLTPTSSPPRRLRSGSRDTIMILSNSRRPVPKKHPVTLCP